jgi:hypothetical protein
VSEFDREFNSEMDFKRQIRSLLWLNRFTFRTEKNIGSDAFGICGARSKSAFVDFVSSKTGAWFIECKMQMGHSDFTKGLGQCIYYRHILKGFSPFLLYPSKATTSESADLFYRVCEANGVTLCTERELVDLLSPLKDREQGSIEPVITRDDSLRNLVLKAAGL